MKIDTFVQLIKDLSTGAIDDMDPNNVVLTAYTSPYDVISFSDSVRTSSVKKSSLVWGDGSTYTATDSNGQQYRAPSCGWLWGSGGSWG